VLIASPHMIAARAFDMNVRITMWLPDLVVLRSK